MAESVQTPEEKKAARKRFLELSVFRMLLCYTLGSLAEIALMTVRVSEKTQLLVSLANDLLSKLLILLLASAIFGFSYGVLRFRALPTAVTRFLHMVLLFVPVVLVSQSLVTDAGLDMQAYVGYYFFAVLFYLAAYGVSMLIMFLLRRRTTVR